MSVINVKVDKKVKEEAIKILDKMEWSITYAITLYLEEVVKQGGIPFIIEKNPKRK